MVGLQPLERAAAGMAIGKHLNESVCHTTDAMSIMFCTCSEPYDTRTDLFDVSLDAETLLLKAENPKKR